jgi:hypothetical protein
MLARRLLGLALRLLESTHDISFSRFEIVQIRWNGLPARAPVDQ